MKQKQMLLLIAMLSCTLVVAQKSEKKNPNYHTFLGVDVDANFTRSNGVHIDGIYKGYGAEKAGLKIGDTLRAINSITKQDKSK